MVDPSFIFSIHVRCCEINLSVSLRIGEKKHLTICQSTPPSRLSLWALSPSEGGRGGSTGLLDEADAACRTPHFHLQAPEAKTTASTNELRSRQREPGEAKKKHSN